MWGAGGEPMAGALQQASGLYRGALALRSRAVLRPLGLLSPPARLLAVPRGPAGGGEPGLEENPFYGRYRDKILALRRSNPGVFESRMEKRSEVKKQPVGHSKQTEFIRYMEEKAGALGTKASKEGFTKDKTLDSILNVEMVKEKTPEEIKQIWKQYFSAKDTVYAVIPAETFDVIWKRARNCPSFLCALPRKEGYEFFVGQWSGTELHFTALINIQTRGETASSQLILYHYPELQKEKGIVLMTAEMDSSFLVRESHIVSLVIF
ncbi:ATP synthase mitochondrial F1 complex assembly factor 1 isoform X2 [Dermochelys coriacea]|uniref:ATP synthase mitochondrial F1 complex assembly factor 1 isoform X2 n=1 Tax=Dermochelys coriacea TaxID=27794 RepID=UPI001CA97D08|nr:ATP synthase mitochondrial F1 complex assembly factor 1 isoform X2 [Dermochelys coriacea]